MSSRDEVQAGLASQGSEADLSAVLVYSFVYPVLERAQGAARWLLGPGQGGGSEQSRAQQLAGNA